MSSVELLKEIQKQIEASLPALQAVTFKKYIEEAEETKKKFEALSTEVLKLNKELSELRDLKTLKLNKEAIEKDKLDLIFEKKKFEIEVKLKDKDVECATSKVALIQQMVDSVFRNTEIRRNVFGTVPVITKNYDGTQYVNRETAQTSEDETRR
jgi:hypothetical protein